MTPHAGIFGRAARVDRMFLRENEEGNRIAPHLRTGQTMLDLGAGTGFMSRWLRDKAGVRPTLCDLVDYGKREATLPFVLQSAPTRVPIEARWCHGGPWTVV